jgi:hypothetical protein
VLAICLAIKCFFNQLTEMLIRDYDYKIGNDKSMALPPMVDF